MKKNVIPKKPNINLNTKDTKRKKELMSEEVKQIVIKEDIVSTINSYSNSSFQARKIGQAAKLYYKQTQKETGIVWTMAGSLFGAGLRQITIDCIRSNLVDILVCTGALFEQDMLEALGHKHYLCVTDIDDEDLEEQIINAIEIYEPRATVTNISSNVNDDQHQIKVTVTFRVVNTNETVTTNIDLTRLR